jgi:hypothetical protein
MAVNLEQLHEIHRLQGEINAAIRQVKDLLQEQDERVRDLPEYQALQEALAVVAEARARLKIAIQDDRELNRLHVEIAEAKFHRRDLGEILSHHLVAYHEDTGRDVIRDMDSHNRKIEFKAKLGKPALDQPRLPLGMSQHFGRHIAIPQSHPIEVKAEEGEQ